MTTFSDLMTLILVFFVLLYSLSVIDTIKFQAFLASFKGVGILDWGDTPLDKNKPENSPTPIEDSQTGEQPLPVAPDYTVMEVFEMVQEYLVETGLENQVELRYEEAGVALDIQDRVLFDTARADLKPEARQVLDPLAKLFARLPFKIAVEGHTDNRSISTVQFPSNWELSGARASRVVRYFIEQHHLDPYQFYTVGHGEFKPVAPNDTEKNMQLNRRVVMVIRAREMQREEVILIE